MGSAASAIPESHSSAEAPVASQNEAAQPVQRYEAPVEHREPAATPISEERREPVRQAEPVAEPVADHAPVTRSDTTIVQAMQAHAPSPSHDTFQAPPSREEPRQVEAPRGSDRPTNPTELRQTVEQSGMVWIETDPTKVGSAPVEDDQPMQARQRRERKPRSTEEAPLTQIETRRD